MPLSSTSSSSSSSVEGHHCTSSPSATSNGQSASNASEMMRTQKEKLVNLLKKEVKHIMEESVMLKAICEDSATVTALCAVVDQCLSLGLRRRALGLFKTNSTTALLQKVSKENSEASQVMRKVSLLEQQGQQRRTLSSGDSTTPIISRLGVLEKASSGSNLAVAASLRFLWIRVALFDKTLHSIVQFLVHHADRYYTKDSLLLDSDYGPLVSSLLAGPCALEYTKLRHNCNLMWSDLPANELVERHRIASGCVTATPISSDSLGLSVSTTFSTSEQQPTTTTTTTSTSESTSCYYTPQVSPLAPHMVCRSLSHVVAATHVEEQRSVSTQAREYVESLHQNGKDVILYGKNNVEVCGSPGYLSLHSSDDEQGLKLKWTPNQVMSGQSLEDKNAGWQRAFSVAMASVLCMHCRRDNEDECGYLGLISHDGTQHPPIKMPPGNHLMALLGCLESALPASNEVVIVPPVDTVSDTNDPKVDVDKTASKKSKRRILPLLKRRHEVTESKVETVSKVETESKVETVVVPNNHLDEVPTALLSNATAMDMVFRLVPMTTTATTTMPSSAPPTTTPRSALSILSSTRSLPSPSMKTPTTPKTKRTSSSDWFANLRVFSPSKSRHNSNSKTDSEVFEESTEIEERERESDLSDVSKEPESSESVSSELMSSESTVSAPITELCHTMRRQLISRAFYGWLNYYRHMNKVRVDLSDLAFHSPLKSIRSGWMEGVTPRWWQGRVDCLKKGLEPDVRKKLVDETETELHHRVYYGGVDSSIRNQVWPFLLGHQRLDRCTSDERLTADRRVLDTYEDKLSDWTAVEAIVRQRDRETTAANIALVSAACNDINNDKAANEVFEPISSRTVSADKISTITEMTETSTSASERGRGKLLSTQSEPADPTKASDEGVDMAVTSNTMSHNNSSLEEGLARRHSHVLDLSHHVCSTRVKVTTPSVDSGHPETSSAQGDDEQDQLGGSHQEQHVRELQQLNLEIAALGEGLENGLRVCDKSVDESMVENGGSAFNSANTSNCYSPASSEGGSFPQELIDNFALNLHRIDKDVQRCDRNLSYFTDANLEKLRNIITTYVWDNLDVGYMQGMCDLVAPILVTLDDEAITYVCFCNLMQRMLDNFPTGTQMDTNFLHMRALIEVLDHTLYEAVISNAEFSQFYFCYRWFLLDFKREFAYTDVFRVWETIWSSRQVASSHFHLFVALALVEKYRDIILDRRMDFTDIIKFFNEMAEKHPAKDILQIARELVQRLQVMITETVD